MIEIPKKIDLVNPEFLQAWNLITHTHQSVFLTGKAGTGKSTFLRYICEHTKKKYVVLAPTGVAAMNVGGVTLHSFFQIPTRPIPPDDSEYSISKASSVFVGKLLTSPISSCTALLAVLVSPASIVPKLVRSFAKLLLSVSFSTPLCIAI